MLCFFFFKCFDYDEVAEGETVSYRTANWRPKGLTKQFKDETYLELPIEVSCSDFAKPINFT